MKKIAIMLILVICICVTGCTNKEENTSLNSVESSEVNEEIITQDIDVDLSEKYYDFEFYLDGKVYNLPCDVQEFLDDGWELEEKDKVVEVNMSYCWYLKKDDTKEILVVVSNVSDIECIATNCKITSVHVKKNDAIDGVQIVFNNNVTIGSTRDKLIETFGEPTITTYLGEDFIHNIDLLDYSISDNDYISFTCNNDNNIIEGIIVWNSGEYTVCDNYSFDDNTEYSERELGEDLFNQKFEIDGVVYELPMTPKELMKNGWDIVLYKNITEIVPNYGMTIYFKKGNSIIKTNVNNKTANTLKIEDAAIINIDIQNNQENIIYELPGGIKRGITIEELENILSGYDFEKNESIKVYTVSNSKYTVKIYYDSDESIVTNVTMSKSMLFN